MLILEETGGGGLMKTLYFCSIKLRLLKKQRLLIFKNNTKNNYAQSQNSVKCFQVLEKYSKFQSPVVSFGIPTAEFQINQTNK